MALIKQGWNFKMKELETVILEKNQKFWHRWMRNHSFGDLAIMGGVGAIARLLLMNYSKTILVHSNGKISWFVLVVAGLVEGFLIGFIEWKSIRKLILLHASAWILLTMLATVIGWLFILSPAIVYISFLSKFTEINRTYFAIYAGIAGLCFGTLVGIPQYLILRKSFKNASFWIFANAISWMLSLIVIYSAIAFFVDSSIINIIITVMACILSGFIQGSITGLSLHYAMVIRQRPLSFKR